MLLLAVLVLICSSGIKANETADTELNTERSTLPPVAAVDEHPNAEISPSIKPFFNFPHMPAPNLFHNFFHQFFNPIKVSSKTYGPSIIAIIGDKPYISLEVFNKFSPFKWLMNAFQGKIQSLCGFLAPPAQDEVPGLTPQNIFDQMLQGNPNQQSGSTVLGSESRPVRIYDIPAYEIRKKLVQ